MIRYHSFRSRISRTNFLKKPTQHNLLAWFLLKNVASLFPHLVFDLGRYAINPLNFPKLESAVWNHDSPQRASQTLPFLSPLSEATPESKADNSLMLSLDSQKIGKDLKSILSSLPLSKDCVVSMNYSQFDQEGFGALLSLLLSHRVVELHLSANQFSNDQLSQLIKTLTHSKYLKILNLNQNKLQLSHLVNLQEVFHAISLESVLITVPSQHKSESIIANLTELAEMYQIRFDIDYKGLASEETPSISIACPNDIEMWAQGGFNECIAINTYKMLDTLIKIVSKEGFCFELNYREGSDQSFQLLGIALSMATGKAFYINLDPDQSERFGGVCVNKSLKKLKFLFESDTVEKTCAHKMRTFHLLYQSGISLSQSTQDIYLSGKMAFKFKTYFFNSAEFEEALYQKLQLKPQDMCFETNVYSESENTCRRAELIFRAHLKLNRKLRFRQALIKFKKIMTPIQHSLLVMDHTGVKINYGGLLKQKDDLMGYLDRLDQYIEHVLQIPNEQSKTHPQDLRSHYPLSFPVEVFLKKRKYIAIVIEKINALLLKQTENRVRLSTIQNFDPLNPFKGLRYLIYLFKKDEILISESSRTNIMSIRFPEFITGILAHKSKDAGIVSIFKKHADTKEGIAIQLDDSNATPSKKYTYFAHVIYLLINNILTKSQFSTLQDYKKIQEVYKKKFKRLYCFLRNLRKNRIQKIHIIDYASTGLSLFTIRLIDAIKKQKLRSKIILFSFPEIFIDVPKNENFKIKRIAHETKKNIFDGFQSTIQIDRELTNKKIPRIHRSYLPGKMLLGEKQDAKISFLSSALPSGIQTLLVKFGIRSLRKPQEDVISHLMSGRDVIAVFPTGYGKSICFQLPALAMKGVTLVVSPLISLIHDQTTNLHKKNISALSILGSQCGSSQFLQDAFQQLSDHSLLYINPECFESDLFNTLLSQTNIALVAIDEVHLLPTWGRSFRKSFLHLGKLKATFPKVPILGLTATATEKSIQDIQKLLCLPNCAVVSTEINRHNLRLWIRQRTDWKEQMCDFIQNYPNQAGILYCSTQDETLYVYQFLKDKGYPVIFYHGGLLSDERARTQEMFMQENRIMIATTAFGMGIDHPGVRFIIHIHMPRNIEEYAQEIGRAGRSGQTADCLMLYGNDDYTRRIKLLETEHHDVLPEHEVKKIKQMQFLCNEYQCRKISIGQYFGHHNNLAPCGQCDVCLEKHEFVDITDTAKIIIQAVISLGANTSVWNLALFLTGQKTPWMIQNRYTHYPLFGALAPENQSVDLSQSDILAIIYHMLWSGNLSESIAINAINKNDDTEIGKIILNDRSFAISRGEKKMMFPKANQKWIH